MEERDRMIFEAIQESFDEIYNSNFINKNDKEFKKQDFEDTYTYIKCYFCDNILTNIELANNKKNEISMPTCFKCYNGIFNKRKS